MKKPTKRHSIERTSPKGTPFIGVCILCGREGLTFKNMSNICTNEPGLTEDEALQVAIQGEKATQ